MPAPYAPSEHSFTCVSGQWLELFTDCVHGRRSEATIKGNDDAGEVIKVIVIARGSPVPTADTPVSRAKYSVEPGTTFPLGKYANYATRIFVRGKSDGTPGGLAWELIG